MSLLGVETNRDGTLALNTNFLKNSFEANPKIVDAIFKDQLTTDNAEVEVTSYRHRYTSRSYAITEDAGDYNIDGVKMSANGTLIHIWIRRLSGMVMNIASSDVSSANIYFGKSLMTKLILVYLTF